MSPLLLPFPWWQAGSNVKDPNEILVVILSILGSCDRPILVDRWRSPSIPYLRINIVLDRDPQESSRIQSTVLGDPQRSWQTSWGSWQNDEILIGIFEDPYQDQDYYVKCLLLVTRTVTQHSTDYQWSNHSFAAYFSGNQIHKLFSVFSANLKIQHNKPALWALLLWWLLVSPFLQPAETWCSIRWAPTAELSTVCETIHRGVMGGDGGLYNTWKI